ncbi:MAG TPA: hypothetical protein VGC58_02960, partial [Candidatus Paceibacterota bacterium]
PSKEEGEKERDNALGRLNQTEDQIRSEIHQFEIDLEIATVAHLESDAYVDGPEAGDVRKVS